MNTEQKQFIEKHIDLIINNDWEIFFKDAPDGTGAYLYDAGIDFMSDIRTIPESCFEFANIDSVIIPEGVTSIGSSAFNGCTSLTSVTIPDSVTIIGAGAFYYCTSLTSVTIPDSVTSIGYSAFSGCKILESVNFNGTIAQWGQITRSHDAFIDTSVRKVICSDGVTNLR